MTGVTEPSKPRSPTLFCEAPRLPPAIKGFLGKEVKTEFTNQVRICLLIPVSRSSSRFGRWPAFDRVWRVRVPAGWAESERNSPGPAFRRFGRPVLDRRSDVACVAGAESFSGLRLRAGTGPPEGGFRAVRTRCGGWSRSSLGRSRRHRGPSASGRSGPDASPRRVHCLDWLVRHHDE